MPQQSARPGDAPPTETPATDIVRSVRRAGDGPTVEVRELRDQLGHTSIAPALLLVSLLIVTPLSGVPGFTTIAGLTIVILCWQYITGRRTIWLPEFILRRRIPRARLIEACSWLMRPLYLLDRQATYKRLDGLTRWPTSGFFFGFCMLLGLVMPLLEAVPMTSTLLGMVIASVAAAFVTRDGMFALWGLAFFALVALAVSALLALLI